ncbi:MAG: DUF4157 domain-containing protein [Cyclobacteriaceae bacterium]
MANSDKQQQQQSQNTSQSLANQPDAAIPAQVHDERTAATLQTKLQSLANHGPKAQAAAQLQAMSANSPHARQIAQLQDKANARATTASAGAKSSNSDLPAQLQHNMEAMSGVSLAGTKVHKNSAAPAQLNAHAYAQGSAIHLAPGQSQHLPHEAWHVVQQKQGRVQPTKQMKGKTAINDDAGLEKEADVMGARAMQFAGGGDSFNEQIIQNKSLPYTIQLHGDGPTPTPNMSDRHLFSRLNFWKGAETNSYLLTDITKDSLQNLYDQALRFGVRDGEVTLRNGQTWYIRQSDGKFFPVRGRDIIQLNRQEVSFLRLVKNHIGRGTDPKQAFIYLTRAIEGQGYRVSTAFEIALTRYGSILGVESSFIAQTFARFATTVDDIAPDMRAAAQSRFSGKTLSYIRWGGRILIVVAVAADAYRIYESENRAKTITTTAGGWAGAAAGAYAGGAAGAWAAGWGAIPGAIVGGAAGYFAGEEITETVYEWIFEEVK